MTEEAIIALYWDRNEDVRVRRWVEWIGGGIKVGNFVVVRRPWLGFSCNLAGFMAQWEKRRRQYDL
jgi:hypothetical protein